MTTISVDDMNRPGTVARLLARLSGGEEVTFHDRDLLGRDTLVFSLEKLGAVYVVRDALGRAFASTTTFAEAWRARPRSVEAMDHQR